MVNVHSSLFTYLLFPCFFMYYLLTYFAIYIFSFIFLFFFCLFICIKLCFSFSVCMRLYVCSAIHQTSSVPPGFRLHTLQNKIKNIQESGKESVAKATFNVKLVKARIYKRTIRMINKKFESKMNTI